LWGKCLRPLLKKLFLISASSLLLCANAFAQGISRRPASTEDVIKYGYMAGVNICALTQKGIPFKTALPASNAMVVVTMRELNGSEVNEGGKIIKLNEQQLENNFIPLIINAVGGLCGGSLKGSDKTDFEKLKAQIDSAMKASKQK